VRHQAFGQQIADELAEVDFAHAQVVEFVGLIGSVFAVGAIQNDAQIVFDRFDKPLGEDDDSVIFLILDAFDDGAQDGVAQELEGDLVGFAAGVEAELFGDDGESGGGGLADAQG
jgi:hypothetical protein